MFQVDSIISRSIEESLQNAEELLERARGNKGMTGLKTERGSSAGLLTNRMSSSL